MPTARNFFTEAEQRLLVEAIARAEKSTSGEIRLHLENFCFGSEIKAAEKVFTRLKMHQTAQRNGVLIYMAVLSHKLAIIGDSGIHEKLGQQFWNDLVNRLIVQLRANRKAEALAACIEECGLQLGKYFPLDHNDQNELDNNISYR